MSELADMHSAYAPPQNESPEHFGLKQAALWWLRKSGCWVVADEVPGMKEHEAKHRRWMTSKGDPKRKVVADAAGLSLSTRATKHRWTLRVIEVKVSRSDWLAGYCHAGHLRYLMTPPGLLRPEELEPGFGLVEVDLENLRWYYGQLVGIEVKKKATRTGPDWTDEEAMEVLGLMAHRLTGYRLTHNEWFGPFARKLRLGAMDGWPSDTQVRTRTSGS